MALAVRLRKATAGDAQALTEIEQESFPDASWIAEDFLRYDCMVAEMYQNRNEALIAGFLVSRQVSAGGVDTPPEREILNLAVSKRFQRNGIAFKLLAYELSLGARLFLEVRLSNQPAIQLYEKAGFRENRQARRLLFKSGGISYCNVREMMINFGTLIVLQDSSEGEHYLMEQLHDEELKAHLFSTNERFRLLADQHAHLKHQIEAIESKPHVTGEDELEEQRMKKLKLSLKDQMNELLASYRHASVN